MLNKIKSFLGQDNRSKNVNKNSIIILICKGVSMLISFFLLPLTIGYVDSDTYGIWITISSMVSWLSIFDVGMGNGLRNKFVEYRAVGDNLMVKKYVSTTYAMLSYIFVPLLIILLIINPYIDWNSLLNVNTKEDLHIIFAIVLSYFSLNFILSTINTILIADQRPGEASIRNVVQHILVLVTIIILTRTTSGTLTILCLVLCVIPLLVMLLFNIMLFNGRYKDIRPSFKDVKMYLVKDLFNLSLKFFYLQIVALILFQLTNFIILRYYSANEVTLYNVAYKYFSLPTAFFTAISTPIWAAITEAIVKNELNWIKESLKRYSYILLLFVIVEILMLIISNPIYKIWMRDTISEIPFLVSFLSMISSSILMSTNVYVSALCGAGYLKLQMIFCIFSPIVFVVLCFFFIQVLHLGVWSVLLANILSNVYGVFVAPWQCYQVFYKGKRGVLIA